MPQIATVENMRLHASKNYRRFEKEYSDYFQVLIDHFSSRTGEVVSILDLEKELLRMHPGSINVPIQRHLAAVQIVLDRDSY